MICPDEDVVSLVTCQMRGTKGTGEQSGSVFYDVHLVRGVDGGGTPGPTLCDIDRFAPGVGWSMMGGTSGPNVIQVCCPGCTRVAAEKFLGVRVAGMSCMAAPFMNAIANYLPGQAEQ